MSTIGATGLGSFLKIVSGIYDRRANQLELREKRKLAASLQAHKNSLEITESIFGKADNETALYSRQTRRIVAIIGMLIFGTIAIIATLYPSAELITFALPEMRQGFRLFWGLVEFPSQAPTTVQVTLGHITIGAMINLGMILGFYFTPGGKN